MQSAVGFRLHAGDRANPCLTSTTEASCSKAAASKGFSRADVSPRGTKATRRADEGKANPHPSGPRNKRVVPGCQVCGMGGAIRKPPGAEPALKTGAGRGESEPSCASKYCPGSGIKFCEHSSLPPVCPLSRYSSTSSPILCFMCGC